MVAAPPSPENPFLTRSKRMRRAKYILEHGAPQPLSQNAAPATAPAQQTEVKPQPAYAFGKAGYPARPNWKPVTT